MLVVTLAISTENHDPPTLPPLLQERLHAVVRDELLVLRHESLVKHVRAMGGGSHLAHDLAQLPCGPLHSTV